MLSYGIGDALHLLVSQNYGAENRDRIGRFVGVGLGASLSLGAALTLGILWLGRSIPEWFLTEGDASAAARAREFLLVVWPLFLVQQTNVLLGCYLTAVQRPKPSATLSLARGLVFPSALLGALVLVLEESFARSSLLVALPLAEWLTFGLAVTFFWRHRPARLPFKTALAAD